MKFFYLFIFPCLLLSQETLTRTQAIMGTFAHITLNKVQNKAISSSFNCLKVIEASLSSYAPHLVYQLNRRHSISYNPTLAHAITLSKRLYKETHGYFDITIGSISKNLYHFGKKSHTLPTQQSLQNARRNIEGIFIHEHNISIAQGIALDLGGDGQRVWSRQSGRTFERAKYQPRHCSSFWRHTLFRCLYF